MHHRRVRCVAISLSLVIASAAPAQEPVRMPRVWSSSGTQYANTDSLAAARTPAGVRLFATSKDGHRVDVFDAATGKHTSAYGRQGAEPGQFNRPNGIVTVEFRAAQGEPARAAVLVVERDNRRIQALWADTLSFAGIFAAGELTKPYGCAVSYRDGAALLYVTDTEVTPEQTVRVYRLRQNGELISAELASTFGEKDGPGRIVLAESVVVDDRNQRVFLCDEDPGQKNVKVYDASGRFTGRVIGGGMVQGDPEGVVVLDSAAGGLFILTDQRPQLSLWHVFDRARLEPIGTFTGERKIANTDGIAVFAGELPGFPRGGFFAVDDDADIHAFDLGAIVARFTGAATPVKP